MTQSSPVLLLAGIPPVLMEFRIRDPDSIFRPEVWKNCLHCIGVQQAVDVGKIRIGAAVFPTDGGNHLFGIDQKQNSFLVVISEIRGDKMVGVQIRTVDKTAFFDTVGSVIGNFWIVIMFSDTVENIHHGSPSDETAEINVWISYHIKMRYDNAENVGEKGKIMIAFSVNACYNTPCVQSGAPLQALGCRQAVRHQTLTLTFVGSNPAIPANSIR